MTKEEIENMNYIQREKISLFLGKDIETLFLPLVGVIFGQENTYRDIIYEKRIVDGALDLIPILLEKKGRYLRGRILKSTSYEEQVLREIRSEWSDIRFTVPAERFVSFSSFFLLEDLYGKIRRQAESIIRDVLEFFDYVSAFRGGAVKAYEKYADLRHNLVLLYSMLDFPLDLTPQEDNVEPHRTLNYIRIENILRVYSYSPDDEESIHAFLGKEKIKRYSEAQLKSQEEFLKGVHSASMNWIRNYQYALSQALTEWSKKREAFCAFVREKEGEAKEFGFFTQ